MYKTEAVYIIAAHRTPIGKLYGALSGIRPDNLISGLIADVLSKYDYLDKVELDAIFLGCGNQAGDDNRNIARMAGLLNGLPHYVFASTVNSLCTSGMDAFMQAARLIMCGEAEFCLAGGVESMSRSPMVESRIDGEKADSTVGWRFVNPKISDFIPIHSMPETAEFLSKKYNIGREQQDIYAFESRNRYENARVSGFFDFEIMAIDCPEGVLKKDEQHRLLSIEMMSQLPSLAREGEFVTLGNSARLGDGAAVLALASDAYIKRHNIKPLVRLHSMAISGEHPDLMGISGANALKKTIAKSGIKKESIGHFELSEAFAVQLLASIEEADLNPLLVNPMGGAISMGNPLGMGAARLLVTLVNNLIKCPEIAYGAAASGAGLGIGTAVIFENLGKRSS
jgi:3-oxoadipyl-CoA thiolase